MKVWYQQKKAWAVMVALAAFSSLPVFAAGLSLDSLLRMGRAANPDLRVVREESRVAASDTLMALTRKNPELGLEASYNLEDPNKPKTVVRLSQEFQSGVRAQQYQVAKANRDTKQQNEKVQLAEVEFEIKSAYYAWQISNQKKVLQVEVEKRWEGLSRLAKAKVKEGRLSEVDEAQAELNLARAKQRELEIQGDLLNQEMQLSYLVGQTLDSNPIAPVTLDSLPTLIGIESLYQQLAKKNPELQMLDKELAAADQQIEFERAMRNPPFALSVGYEKETDGTHLIGGGVTFPLQILNRNAPGIGKARRQKDWLEARRKTAEIQLKSEVAITANKLLQLRARYQAYEINIRPLSRKQLELSEKGFLQGLLGIFDLSRVQEEFLSQELEALDILTAYYEASNRLEKAVGVLE